MPSLSEDRDAIRDVLARVCLYRDTGAVDEWLALFTPDAELHVRRDPIAGHAALRDYAENGATGLHHLLTDHIIEVDGDDATCIASLVVLSGGAIQVSARTHDELRRADGQWLLARRAYVLDRKSAD